jgi:hypothetical protein
MSDDHLLCQQVARTYRELGEQLMQMQQLRTAITHAEQSKYKYSQANTASDKSEDTFDRDVEYHNAAAYDSSTAEVFLNCVSRFSANDPYLSIDRLRANFSGSPDYSLETSSSFYPEQYAVDSPERIMFVSAILPLPSHPRSQRYFLTFQEQARRWQRVIIVATFDNLIDCSAIIQISTSDNLGSRYTILPKLVQSSIRKVLRHIENFGFVTNISIHLKENDNGQITADTTRMETAEDMLERDMSSEDRILQDIEHLGCHQFRESEVITKSRITCHRNQVWVRGKYYIERKVPFASAGLQGDNAFDDFVNEVRRLNSLRRCAGIAQFIGVILDDTGRHLKGYLCEAPIVHILRTFIGLANSLSKTIPWTVRELWMQQIVAAMSNLHTKGLVSNGGIVSRVVDPFLIYTRVNTP